MAVSLFRVVLDTNIVVSAFWGGLPGKVVRAWIEERYTLPISAPILTEYKDVLERLHPGSPAANRFLHAVYLRGVTVHSKETLHVIRQDPDDDRFLECAVAGKAHYIVTGDRHLLRLKHYRGIHIVTPREFLTGLRSLNG